jgi:hypothetical protein
MSQKLLNPQTGGNPADKKDLSASQMARVAAEKAQRDKEALDKAEAERLKAVAEEQELRRQQADANAQALAERARKMLRCSCCC